ncbi:MAG TPA: ABC transporter permease [Actinomycetaceae bacterium]|nr:ABC transporter permease [Actinomycetaceae bacterium]
MLRLTLAQMRRSTGRLVAAGLAIAIGTAFITATLLGTGMVQDTTRSAVTASIAHADVVVRNVEQPLDADQLTDVRSLPETGVADGRRGMDASLSAGGRQSWAGVVTVPSPGLEGEELLSGDLPRAATEIAVNHSVAERLGLEIGDTLELSTEIREPDSGWDEPGTAIEHELTVVGTLTDPSGLIGMGNTAMVTAAAQAGWVEEAGLTLGYDQVLIRAAEGTTPEQAAAAVSALLPDSTVTTGDDYADSLLADLIGQAYILTAIILAFGGLAMFVAAIVITNTFQVLVAQRTHTLALLRAVGATRAQIRRSVFTEATLLGALAGLAGLLLGVGLAQAALWVLQRQDLPFPVPEGLALSWPVVVVPLLTGAVVTLLAASSPARAATAVSPLAALRPAQSPDPRGASRPRLVLTVILLVLGGAMVALAPMLSSADGVDEETAVFGGLALGLLGGLVSFTGVMLGMVFLAGPLVRLLGRVVGRLGGGPATRIATANAARNPRRTAATATALVIGVTLVTLVSTGAVSARASLDLLLRDQFPVDLSVESMAWDSETGRSIPLTSAQIETVQSTEGVSEVLEIPTAYAELHDGTDQIVTVTGLDPEQLPEVVRSPDNFVDVAADTAVVGPYLAQELGLTAGSTVELGPSEGATTDGGTAELTVVIADLGSRWSIYTTPDVVATIDPGVQATLVWARLAEDADQVRTINAVEDSLTELGATTGADVPYISGPAAERALFEQVIDTLLAIVTGLLAVAVVIALIGVANTLSLSVIERRRESALLRAMGLTRGQLRRMLAIEGVFLALAGVLVGLVAGLLYGWAGTGVLLGQADQIALAVPWGHVAAIVVVAVLAGLTASVLPARSAARTPPVAALAAE